MTPILTIDDLEQASQKEISAAKVLLDIKGRVLGQLKKEGQYIGLTLEQYREILSSSRPYECPYCGGWGEIMPPKPREVGVIHPSSAHLCKLRLYFDVTGEIAPQEYVAPETQITYAIGHAIHDQLQGALGRHFEDLQEQYDMEGEDEQCMFEAEAKVDIDGLVRGRTDGRILLPNVGAIWEIKTAGPTDYDSLRDTPIKKHRLQAGGLYTKALNLPFTVYTYVSKIYPHPIKEFVEPYDPSIFRAWWRKKGQPVQEALDNGSPPIADAKPAECRQCIYEHECPQSLAKRTRLRR